MNRKIITVSDKLPGRIFNKAVFPGKYIQGERALAELPGLVNLLGKNGLILASPTAKNKILPGYIANNRSEWPDIELFNGECCESEINRILDIISTNHVDVLTGMGGGKTIDTVKIAADRAGIPVIVVPTIASTDAPCSGCAVIYSETGVFESVYYQKMNPQVVLVDMTIMANAPTRFLVSGMGDALATWFEAKSCQLTGSKNECGGYTTMAAIHLARLCYDTLLKYGSEAKSANDHQMVTPALNYIVEANTLLSGIGFESSGLAAAHSIHNGFTVLKETHNFYHGEKVAFGVLTGLYLTGTGNDELNTVYSFCETIGLPTTLRGIGILNNDREELMAVAKKSCAPTEGIHHEATHVTPEKVLEAMLAADTMGRNRITGRL